MSKFLGKFSLIRCVNIKDSCRLNVFVLKFSQLHLLQVQNVPFENALGGIFAQFL